MNAVLRPAWRRLLVASAGIFLTAPALATGPPAGVFLENIGQFDDAVLYRTTLGNTVVWFTDDGIVLDLVDPATLETPSAARAGATLPGPAIDSKSARRRGCVVRIRFDGSNPDVAAQGQQPRAAPTHFILGNDPSRWVSGARSFEAVTYRDLWPGIDLTWRVRPGRLEYDVVVRPGADAAQVAFTCDGQTGLANEAGAIRLDTPFGSIVLQQSASGAAGALPFGGVAGPPSARGVYDFAWCTFVGGGLSDRGFAVTADAQSRPITGGQTWSSDFPTTTGAYDESLETIGLDDYDAFVTKLTDDGTALEWSTYLGGIGGENVTALLVDNLARVIAIGYTSAQDFPTTPGAFDETASAPANDWDVFVTMLTPDGSELVWSTYLGKGKYDVAVGATLDADQNVLVAGHTLSPGFPTTPGALKETHSGDPFRDGFLTKLSAAGDSLVWSTLLGDDAGNDWTFAVEMVGDNPVVVGWTESVNFWTTPGAFDLTMDGPNDGYILELAPDGSSLVWSTYMGGSAFDFVSGVALDPVDGNLLFAGRTDSPDFPVTPGAFDLTFNGPSLDAVVLSLSADGSSLIWSTFLGGTGGTGNYVGDWPWDLDVGPNGVAVLAGSTTSLDFPVTANAPYPAHSGGVHDGFITVVSRDGSDLLLSTFCGGSTDGNAWEGFNAYENVEVVGGRVYVGGEARSTDFPVSDGSFDTSLGGVVDAVLVTLTLPPVAAPEIPAPTTDRLQLACSPNPFRGVTEIRYSLPVASAVAITVHEVAGRLVRTLAANEQTVAGPHRISWDGRDDTGLLAAGGVYFVRVKTTEREEAVRVVLLR